MSEMERQPIDLIVEFWSRRRDLNPRPSDYKWILGGAEGVSGRPSPAFSFRRLILNHPQSPHGGHTGRHTSSDAQTAKIQSENPQNSEEPSKIAQSFNHLRKEIELI